MSSPKLFVARETLQDSTIPLQLRVPYYLRILCQELAVGGMSYSHLMKVLFTANPDWLNTCEITPNGELKSSDATINQWLLPLEQGYWAVISTVIPLPMAA